MVILVLDTYTKYLYIEVLHLLIIVTFLYNFANNIHILEFTFKFGKQSRMWCMRSLLSVLVRYGVPLRLAKEGYFLCKKYDSSLRALEID